MTFAHSFLSCGTAFAGAVAIGGLATAISGSQEQASQLTVAECLNFSAALQGRRHSPEEIHTALARWGIGGLRQAPVRTLSQGQRRRVTLARLALSMDHLLWLLDEPFDALDADGVAALNELLAEHAGRGGATLLTSHQALSLAEPVPHIFDLDHHVFA